MADIARSHTRLIRHIGTVPAQLWQCEHGLIQSTTTTGEQIASDPRT